MKAKNILMMASLMVLTACGGGGGGGGSNGPAQAEREYVEATPGTYYSVLRPVNFHSNGFIPYGSATFKLQGDQLEVSVNLDDDQPVAHRQALHMGSRCPTLADDTNGDKFIDYEEAMAVVGPALMPLDNDLNAQLAGAEVYPRGRSMTYKKLASLTRINADLWKADEDPSDNIMKLSRDRGVGFEGRVVLVHGTSPQSSFPSSLASYKGEAAHISLPVVCGILEKID